MLRAFALATSVGCLLIIIAAVLGAAESAALPAELRLVGRWDRRAPDRAITVNSGSFVLARFSGTAAAARFDLALNKPPLPTIAWRIDEGEWQEAEVAAQVMLGEKLGAGPHTLLLMARGLDEHQSRWSPPLVASITWLGLVLPDAGKLLPPLPEWDKPKLKMEFLGDSITEGVLVQDARPGKGTWPWRTDGRLSYAGVTATTLGAQWRQVGFGATALTHGGSGGAPSALDSLNLFYAGCPRDDWQPDVVLVNQGTNDGGTPPATFQPLYVKYLALIRQAYPAAKIVALRPFNGAQADGIRAAVAAQAAAGDKRLYYIDSTGWHAGALHPNAADSAKIAEKLVAALREQVLAK